MKIPVLLLIFVIDGIRCQVTTQSHEGSLVRPTLGIQTRVTDDNGNGILETGESGSLIVIVSNRGGRARNVTLRLQPVRPVEGLLFDAEAQINEIPAGETREAKFVLRAYDDVATQDAPFNVEINDLSRLNHEFHPVTIIVRALGGPEFVLTKSNLLSDMFGPSVRQVLRDREMFLELEIRNAGQRRARDAIASVEYDSLACEVYPGGTFRLGEMPPSAQRSIYISFRLNRLFRSDSVKFVVRCAEKDSTPVSEFPLTFPVRTAPRSR